MRLDRRRVERLLQVHAEVDHVQEELQRPLVLLVAAGRAEGQPRLRRCAAPATGDNVVRGRLPGTSAFGVPLVEVEHLAARAEREAEPLDHGRRADPAAAGRRREEIAPAIDGVDVGGIAGDDAASVSASRRRDRARRRDAARGWPAARSISSRRSAAYSSDSSQPDRHGGELGIAVVALAVGEGELGALEVHVQVLGGVVAERAQVEAFEKPQLLQQDRTLAPGAAL